MRRARPKREDFCERPKRMPPYHERQGLQRLGLGGWRVRDRWVEVTPGALLGQVVAGKYRIDSVIGEGGMGFVVVAHHMQLETKVAIKLLRPELASSTEAVERFA